MSVSFKWILNNSFLKDYHFSTEAFLGFGEFLNHQRVGGLSSIHWLLEEPIVLGSRFDVAGNYFPGLKNLLCEKMVLQLQTG